MARVGDASLRASSILFPQGTVQSGLPGIATSQGTTTIQFPFPGAITRPDEANATHKSTFGIAYANDIALRFLSAKQGTMFPQGAVLVRERLSEPNGATPDVLVVMIKEDKGFNPKANDWEFLTVSGDLKKIEKREKDGKCRACHAAEAGRDYVFRYPAP